MHKFWSGLFGVVLAGCVLLFVVAPFVGWWLPQDAASYGSKVDGLFYWLFINEAGERKPHYGRFTILDRPSKVQYTWMSLHTRGLESLVTVTFRKKGEDTLLTLRHENLPDDEYGRGHEKGWSYFLSRFADRFREIVTSP